MFIKIMQKMKVLGGGCYINGDTEELNQYIENSRKLYFLFHDVDKYCDFIEYKRKSKYSDTYYKVNADNFEKYMRKYVKWIELKGFFTYCAANDVLLFRNGKAVFHDARHGKATKVYMIKKKIFDYIVRGEIDVN